MSPSKSPSKSPSGLRQRQTASPTPADKDSVSTPSQQAGSRSSKASRYLLVLVSLALSTTYFYLHYHAFSEPYGPDYALCSPNGAKIYTVDADNPKVQCIVVQNGYFVDAGSLGEVKQRWNSVAAVLDANATATSLPVRFIPAGAIIVPGITDSHTHTLEYGFTKVLPLEGTRTVRETVGRIRQYIDSKPDLLADKSKIVEGWGWDHTKWLETTWPSSADLESDPVVAGRPIILQSKDGHALWVSQNILTAMQPLPDEVEGGVIIRDESGQPTGVLLDNAQILANAHRPVPTYEQLQLRFNLTVQDAVAHGLTSVHDAGFDPVSLEFFRRYAEETTLPIRVYGMTHFNESSEYWGDRAQKIMGSSNGRLIARSVKIFADGALRTGGAALYEPYTDNPSTSGFMRIEPEVLKSIIPRFLKDGWQVNVHAIGDRANGLVLDAFEAALQHANVTALRPRLEHAQILAEKDMARFGALGVIASIQPTHATDDMWYAEERLGPERIKSLYAFRSILDHGGRITLGSDMPVEGVNPLAGFYAAITRLTEEGTSPHGPGGWFPEQRMSRMEALKGMTLDPAYASFSDDTLGSISIGKRADYVVFSQDIMTIATEKILQTQVLATVIDGGVVYGSI
ncbi:amidohydrolase family-domain-containing protein [Irpex rosettiformis]|uniref:Amidohydrolase family-domain-containing protein n=1 Tax=Irpex rosettiformis TaxID=378272 RepID=A0ACB8UGD4_9APHY|nr:amidohydrolase family-domain-containing protein [Irpex rosettiformis]